MKDLWKYIVSVGDATSQLVGRLLTYTNTPNESISGAAYRRDGAVKKVIDWVFSPLERNHTKKAYLADLARAINTVVEAGMRVEKGEGPPEAAKATLADPLDHRISETAPFYEMHWSEFEKDITNNRSHLDDWRHAAQQADWEAIVATYPDEVLRHIELNGTVFAFSKALAKRIRDAVVQEKTRRNTAAPPSGHGMNEQGAQE